MTTHISQKRLDMMNEARGHQPVWLRDLKLCVDHDHAVAQRREKRLMRVGVVLTWVFGFFAGYAVGIW